MHSYQCKCNLLSCCITFVLNHMFPMCTPGSLCVSSFFFFLIHFLQINCSYIRLLFISHDQYQFYTFSHFFLLPSVVAVSPYPSYVRTHGSELAWRTAHFSVKFSFYKSHGVRREWRTPSFVRTQHL